jgi:hypothetical protein
MEILGKVNGDVKKAQEAHIQMSIKRAKVLVSLGNGKLSLKEIVEKSNDANFAFLNQLTLLQIIRAMKPNISRNRALSYIKQIVREFRVPPQAKSSLGHITIKDLKGRSTTFKFLGVERFNAILGIEELFWQEKGWLFD